MTLYLIGLGLGDEKDITIKGLEIVKQCDFIYLENYTSKLNCKIEDLEKLYNKKIILADRNLIENKAETILNNAKNKDVALLIIGDPFGATTHSDIVQRAEEKNINVKIIHNCSILNAVGETGLSLYNFGKTTSIPFDNKNITSPIKFIKDNQKLGMHTLILLDLNPKENKFMSASHAIEYLIKNKVKEDTLAVVCCALGSDSQIIRSGKIKYLKNINFNAFPQCLIIPGKMHFMESESIARFS